MARSRADDIIEGWKMVAHNVPRPSAEAPFPQQSRTRTAMPLGLAAAAAVVVLVAALAFRGFGSNPPVAGGSPTASATPTATLGSSMTPTSSPAANPSSASVGGFSTSGVDANWTGFTWAPLPASNPLGGSLSAQLLVWRDGYVVYGAKTDTQRAFIWTSPDGENWRVIDGISGTSVMVVESPDGLVAITSAGDPVAPTQTVWTSADGVSWTNRGAPRGAAALTSLAGTSAGLVAVSTTSPDAKGAGSAMAVVYSTDGITWMPETVEPGLAFDSYGPRVQSGAGRFFLMGLVPGTARASGLSLTVSVTTGTSVVWWSDDGKTWTRSTGTLSGQPISLDFARNGILLHTRQQSTPGGQSLYRSTDGGKTWVTDQGFGPLGVEQCQGECSVGPDGAIAGNGAYFVAVKNDGHAWVSADGATWTAISWSGGPTPPQGMLVLPRGIVLAGSYGAAK